MSGKSKLIRIKLQDGSEAVFETDLAETKSEKLLSGGEDNIYEADETFDKLVARIRPVAETLLNSLKDFNTPQEINLEFGIKLSGKAGIVFASAASECNFKVGLKWTNPRNT